MADVKWIKITTDIFDDEKMAIIDGLPEHDSIIVIWFKLLCLAGKQNNGGVFILNDKIAYTDEMLAAIFRRPLNTVRLALNTFEQFGMVEIINGAITIPNWGKHQSLDAYEKKKERDRIRIARKRAEQKALVAGMSPDMSPDVAPLEREEDKEEDKDKEEGKEEANKSPVPYSRIQSLYNELCPSLPSCRSLSESRKKAIRARFNAGYTEEDFRSLFVMAENSAFLKGSNTRNWTATFDWLIKDSNMAKVLDGNYRDKKGGGYIGQNGGNPGTDELYGTYL